MGGQSYKLCVTYFPPATSYRPVCERRYTFAKNVETGDCCLTIGYCFDESIIHCGKHKDMFFQWTFHDGKYVLNGTIFPNNKNHYQDLMGEVQEALISLVNGDKKFFLNYPNLLVSPIYIHILRNNAPNNEIIYVGMPKQYIND